MPCPIKNCAIAHDKIGDDFSRWEALGAAGIKLHAGGHHLEEFWPGDLPPLAYRISIGAYDAAGFFTDEETETMMLRLKREEEEWRAEMRRLPTTQQGWRRLMGLSSPFDVVPRHDPTEVKRRTDFARILENAGVKIPSTRRKFVTRCPFHEDRTASFSVDLDEKLYNCFGCGEAGDVIRFVERMEGVSFKESLELLNNQ